MLSQRIALGSADLLRRAEDRSAPSTAPSAPLLSDAIDLMYESHRRLSEEGVDDVLRGRMGEEIAEMYFGDPSIDARVRTYLGWATELLRSVENGTPPSDPELVATLDYITAAAEGPLLAGLDSVVSAYQRRETKPSRGSPASSTSSGRPRYSPSFWSVPPS